MTIDVCMMNEPTPDELASISRCIQLWALMYQYIPSSQYVWSSGVPISQVDTFTSH